MSCFRACSCQRTRCRAATESKCKKGRETRGNKLQETRTGLFTPACSAFKQRFACEQRVVDLPSTSQELFMSDPLLQRRRLRNESVSLPGSPKSRQTDDKPQRCWFPAKAPLLDCTSLQELVIPDRKENHLSLQKRLLDTSTPSLTPPPRAASGPMPPLAAPVPSLPGP